jgi:hypothetical protein
MLTANDRGGNGGLIKYRQGAGPPDLYEFLKDKLKKRHRKISYLREYFSSNGLQFRYCPHGDSLDREFTNKDRDAYFRSIPNRDLKEAVILLDPDNGLEVKSATDRTWHKYIKFEEVKDLYHRMDESTILCPSEKYRPPCLATTYTILEQQLLALYPADHEHQEPPLSSHPLYHFYTEGSCTLPACSQHLRSRGFFPSDGIFRGDRSQM